MERNAIDVLRRLLGVEYQASKGQENLEKMGQEHWDITPEIVLHMMLLDQIKGMRFQ